MKINSLAEMERNQRIECHCKYTISLLNGMGWTDDTTKERMIFSVPHSESEDAIFDGIKYDIKSNRTLEGSESWLAMKITIEMENGPITRRYSGWDI